MGVTDAEKAPLQGSVVYCRHSSCHVSYQLIQGHSLKRVFECPLLVVCAPCPLKAVAIHLTLVSYFPALSLSHENKHPLGNTVKVLLVLLDVKGKGSEKIPKHE